MLELRQHQTTAVERTDIAHNQGYKNAMVVLSTGAGKTIIMAYWAWRCQQRGEGAVIFAHRDVLLEQISNALCQFGVYHSLYCAKTTRTFITNKNHVEHGNSFHRETSMIILASVDTFWRMDVAAILPYIKYWMMDEAHHMTIGSKWHRCIEKLDAIPYMRGLLVTATPLRADKKGLGRHASGIADILIDKIADMQTLIGRGILSKYKIYVPESQVDVSDVNVTSSGDYNRDQLAKKTDNSKITGSVIENWLTIAGNKQTIIFTVNIEHSNHVAEQFRIRGIKAVALSSEDAPAKRQAEITNFRNGLTTILINCDLFSEGFDVPAVVCVVMLRKTLSYGMFKQQFGRMLRVLTGKEYGILIDHVGNVPYFMDEYNLRYPHDDPDWTLDDQPKKSRGAKKHNLYQTITCNACRAYYVPTDGTDEKERCPQCGHYHSDDEKLEQARSFQERKGKLVEMELDPDLFKQALDERDRIDASPEFVRKKMQMAGAPAIAYNAAFNNHSKRRNAQVVLRCHIQEWCLACYKRTGWPPPLVQREFELVFNIPVLKAHLLSEPDALQLTNNIQQHMIGVTHEQQNISGQISA